MYLQITTSSLPPPLPLCILLPVNVSDEYAEAARILTKLEPGFLPFEIFHQVARLVVLPIVEIVPLRTNPRGDVEVLLLERTASDPIFPGQVHTPGCVVLATDTPGSFETAFQRIMHDELDGVQTSEPVYVTQLLHHSGRGMESTHVYWAEVFNKPATGTFYPVSDLPNTFMKSQLDFLPLAVASYQAATNGETMFSFSSIQPSVS